MSCFLNLHWWKNTASIPRPMRQCRWCGKQQILCFWPNQINGDLKWVDIDEYKKANGFI